MTPTAQVRASLVPVVAFIAAGVVADPRAAWWRSTLGFLLASPLVVGFVGLPAWASVAVARHRWVQWSVVATMSAVAAATAVAMVRSEDALAGMVVVCVPCVGALLAIVVIVGEAASHGHR